MKELGGGRTPPNPLLSPSPRFYYSSIQLNVGLVLETNQSSIAVLISSCETASNRKQIGPTSFRHAE